MPPSMRATLVALPYCRPGCSENLERLRRQAALLLVEDDDGATHDVAARQRIQVLVDVVQCDRGDGVLDQSLRREREHLGEVVVVTPERAEIRLLSIRERQQR